MYQPFQQFNKKKLPFSDNLKLAVFSFLVNRVAERYPLLLLLPARRNNLEINWNTISSIYFLSQRNTPGNIQETPLTIPVFCVEEKWFSVLQKEF